MKIYKKMVIATAVITILSCLFGLFYIFSSLITAFSGGFESVENQPYFHQAFYIMSSICIVLKLCLICFSVDLLRGNLRTVNLFAAVLIFEILYTFSIGAFWLHPKLGRSIAGASGVANGGLMAQFIVLLPLWAPIVLRVAKRKLQHQSTANNANEADVKKPGGLP